MDSAKSAADQDSKIQPDTVDTKSIANTKLLEAVNSFLDSCHNTKNAELWSGGVSFEHASMEDMLLAKESTDETRKLFVNAMEGNPTFVEEFIIQLAIEDANLTDARTNTGYRFCDQSHWVHSFHTEERKRREEHEYAIKHLAHLECVKLSPKLTSLWETVFDAKCSQLVAQHDAQHALDIERVAEKHAAKIATE